MDRMSSCQRRRLKRAVAAVLAVVAIQADWEPDKARQAFLNDYGTGLAEAETRYLSKIVHSRYYHINHTPVAVQQRAGYKAGEKSAQNILKLVMDDDLPCAPCACIKRRHREQYPQKDPLLMDDWHLLQFDDHNDRDLHLIVKYNNSFSAC